MEKHPQSPPKWGERILNRFVPPGIKGRSIIGDAREEYLEHLRSVSRVSAGIRYWKTVLSIVLNFRRRPKRREENGSPSNNERSSYLDALLYDLKLAVRMLAKKPGLTLAAVITLGLGIGANTMIFSIVNTVLLAPLPYEEPERLVGVFRIDPELTGRNPTPSRISSLFAVPLPVYRDWRRLSQVFESSGAFGPNSLTLTGGDGPEEISGANIDSGVFDALGVRPIAGRNFLPEEDEVGAPRVAILSYGLWQRRFGSDPDILGQEINLSGSVHTIVGVMPRGFSYPFDDTELWVSFKDEHIETTVRNGGWLQVIARLRDGISLEQAQLEMDGVARLICEEHPEECEQGIGLFPAKELLIADTRSGLMLLLGAVGLVLLIACANMANLLLVRTSERRRELGLRQALGAGHSRLLIHHLSESTMLSLVGGALGCLIAVVGLRPLVAAFPEGLPRTTEITVDFRLLLFTAGLSLLTGLLIGLLPALRSIREPVVETLRDGGRGFAGGRQRNRTQALLVVSEIALTFVLLAGAALFIESFSSLSAVDPGFDASNLLVMSIELPGPAGVSEEESENAAQAFFTELDEKLLSLPGVTAVGRANQMPFVSGLSFPPTSVDGSDGIVEDNIHNSTVTPEYFTTLGIPLVAGRGFTSADRKGSQLVALASETMARKFWADDDPLGRRVRIDIGEDLEWITIVGVVGDVKHRLNWDPYPEFYLPFAQWPTEYQNVVMETAVDPAILMPSVRETVWAIDPNLPVSVRSLEDRINRSNAVVEHGFRIFLLGCLSGVAALLAVVGVYGVLAYTVSQRSNEIGIRLALGAGKRRVIQSILERGLAMAGIGLVIGWVLAVAASRVMESLLFEVSPTDPMTLAGVALLVAVAAAAASAIPAVRATRVDPVEALKKE